MSASVSAPVRTQTLRLSRPVQAHGELVTELHFREPTGNDAWECGLPIKWSQDNEMVLGMPSMMQLASRMAAVPLSTLKAMPLSDLMKVVGVITSFLGGPDAAATGDTDQSSGPLTSHGSGEPIPLPSLRSA